jgi:hypothetical protein
MNNDLVDLQKSLLTLIDALRDRLAAAQSKEEVDALLREIQEVFHRATLVGSLLFTATTAAATARAQQVRDGTDSLRREIQNIGTVKNILKAVTSLLTSVDRVIDLVKMLPL